MNTNVTAAAENASNEEILSVTRSLGFHFGPELEIEIGYPQIVASGVYQCEWIGDRLAYRMHVVDSSVGIPSPNGEWEFTNKKIAAADIPHAPNFGREIWQDAIERYKGQAIISSWDSDEIVKKYAQKSWVLDGLIEQNAIAWFYGAPYSYKSFMAMDIACSVATGRNWCGRAVKRGPVLYVSAEGGEGNDVARVGWQKDRGIKAEYLRVLKSNPDITKGASATFDTEAVTYSGTALSLALDQFKSATGEYASLIIVDTYAQTAPDDTKDAVTKYERELRKLIKKHAPGAAVLVIDHSTKEGGTWMGSLAKMGNMETMAAVIRPKSKDSDSVMLTMREGKGKVKNAEPFDDIKLSPRKVNLGIQDYQGREMTTLVLDHETHSLTDNESTLRDLIGEGMKYGELRLAWENHSTNEGVKPGTVRQRFNRAFDKLVTLDIIDFEGDEKDDDSYVFLL